MILEFEHVTGNGKNFRLSDINFALPPGYIMGIAGKNGAGKTTLFDYIVNPRQQYNGTIRVGGEDIRKNHAGSMQQIGFVSDKNEFLLDRTAKQNAEIFSIAYENWDMELFLETMKKMELSPHKVVGKMSRGETMKFQTAFAMAHGSILYLLDEVTAGMDPVFRMDFFKILHEIIEAEQASVVMTSHIEAEMNRKMDYVGILEEGKLISFGEAAYLEGGKYENGRRKKESGHAAGADTQIR